MSRTAVAEIRIVRSALTFVDVDPMLRHGRGGTHPGLVTGWRPATSAYDAFFAAASALRFAHDLHYARMNDRTNFEK